MKLSAPRAVVTGMIAALVGWFQPSTPSYSADDGLFGEPALDVVLYGDAYQFPVYDSLDVLTQRNDNNRSGASHWPGVNQNSIRQFRKIGELSVGADAVVTAQPLYAHSAIVRNVRQPVLIVATSNNVVFAFAPFAPSGAALLWRTPGDPPPLGLGAPLKAPPDGRAPAGANCSIGAEAVHSSAANSSFLVGIEATPVIDVANRQVLVGFKTDDGNQRLAAIDLNDGHIKKSVVVPAPHAAANPDWAKVHRNRASLLLVDGVVYLAFSSLCEGTSQIMHGSLVAFDARTLAHVGEFQVTDDRTDGGGIWQGSTGPAADTDGNLYFVTGNRRLPNCLAGFGSPNTSDPDAKNLSNSVVRLRVEKRTSDGRLARSDEAYSLKTTVEDYFTPYRKLLGDCWDLDLGSAGPLLIPGTRFVVAGGKEGRLYVLDRSNMGGFDRAGSPWDYVGVWTGLVNLMQDDGKLKDDAKRDRAWQKFQAGVNRFDTSYPVKDLMRWPHIHGTPVFARFGTDRAFMFVWPEKDTIQRYQWGGEGFDRHPAIGKELAPPYLTDGLNGMPGGMLSVNVDPRGPSLGVVLAAVKVCNAPDKTYSIPGNSPQAYSNPHYARCDVSQDVGILRAYDPFNMEQVWTDEGKGEDYWFAKFVPPTVAADRIFLPTASGKVIVYGQ